MLRISRTLVLAAFLGPLAAWSQELVVNGGFETGNFTGWSNPGNFVVNDNAAPYAGTRNARFPNGTLSQTFTTVPGLEYIFSYFVGHTGTNTLNSFLVTLNDGGSLSSVQNLFNQGNVAYSQTIFSYIATGSTATIRFTSTFTNIGGGSGRYVLDDVSFFQVGAPELDPTASTLPLLTVGLMLGLGLERRKRQA